MSVARVSVLLPAYNAERYLAEAIESIREQSFADFELLVLDDGSTDNSLAIAQEYARADERIVVLRGQRRGLSASLNLGLQMARGEYIARMDADDISIRDRFSLQVAFLDQHQEFGLVGAHATRVDEDGLDLGPWRVPAAHDEIDRLHMAGTGGAIIHPLVMMRRGLLLQIGGYRSDFDTAEDYDLFLRMGEICRLGNLPQTLLRYRVHRSSITLSRIESQRSRTRLALADAWRRRSLPGVPPPPSLNESNLPCAEEFTWMWAREAFGSKNYRTARKYALKLLKAQPADMKRWILFGAACLGPGAQWARALIPYRVGDYRRDT